MLTYRPILPICLSLALFACSSAAKKDPQSEMQGLFPSAMATMELYDASFHELFDKHVLIKSTDHEQLAVLNTFYSKYSIWARINSQNTMISLRTGRSNLVLAIYDTDHPQMKIPGSTLSTHQGEHVEIHIRPHRMSRAFAGIFLIHELSHAADMLNKTQTEYAEVNETKAYFHQKKAANIAYGGALDRALDKLLAKLDYQDVTDMIRLYATREGHLKMQDMLIGLEDDFKVTPPESREEAEMRLAFYTIALEIRRQENQNTGKDKNSISAKKIGQLLQAISKY